MDIGTSRIQRERIEQNIYFERDSQVYAEGTCHPQMTVPI